MRLALLGRAAACTAGECATFSQRFALRLTRVALPCSQILISSVMSLAAAMKRIGKQIASNKNEEPARMAVAEPEQAPKSLAAALRARLDVPERAALGETTPVAMAMEHKASPFARSVEFADAFRPPPAQMAQALATAEPGSRPRATATGKAPSAVSDGVAKVLDVPKSAPVDAQQAERRNKCLLEARALLPLLPPRSLRVAGGLGSRVVSDRYEVEAVDLLADQGGERATNLINLRLFLVEYETWFASQPGRFGAPGMSLFPISSADAVSARRVFATAAARDRVQSAMQFADRLGLPVTYEESAFITKNPKVAASAPGSKAREAPGPWFVHSFSERLRVPPADITPARLEKMREFYVDALLSARSGGLQGSKMLAPDHSEVDKERPVDVFSTVTAKDKLGRADVKQWAPMVDLVSGEVLSWGRPFAAARDGKKFVISDWVNGVNPVTGKPGAAIAHAVDVARDPGGGLLYCPEKRAYTGLCDCAPDAFGVSSAELKARKLSGTHIWRHLAGEVTEELEWPAHQADVLGDWSPAPKDPAAQAGVVVGAKRRRASGASSSTRRRYYAPHASRKQQLHARRRFAAAIKAGIAHFGAANLSKDTEWAEIFPKPAPSALAEFYGSDSAYPDAGDA